MSDKKVSSDELSKWQIQLKEALEDLHKEAELNEKKLLVIGCSTSEVIGEHIGTAGTLEVAKMLFEGIKDFQEKTGVQLAFQGCEHINRALVVSGETAEKKGYDEVSVIPVRHAGGALATYAFEHLENAVVVEHIKADAGIDIGDTLIGMHLKHVAVPVRSAQKQIGHAHITMAKTRPKLIGGPRAQYGK